MLARMWRKGSPCTLLVGIRIGAINLENSMEVPQKTKNRTTICSSNSIPEYISKENKNNFKRYTYPYVHNSIIYNNQDMKATYVSINRRLNEDVMQTHTHAHTWWNEIPLSHKKNDILPLATTWMDLEGTMSSEVIRQRKTNTANCMSPLVCGI